MHTLLYYVVKSGSEKGMLQQINNNEDEVERAMRHLVEANG